MQDADRDIQNICLIGFMGVGKSTVGQMVAGQLGFEFLDTDAQIERSTGKSISRIFAEDGEPHFRACEAQVVEQLSGRSRLVIASGGGLAANPAHLASLQRHSLVIWLWASPEAIWERVRHQHHRPLLRTEDPQARIRGLLAEREPVYRRADVLLNTDVRSPRELAHSIVGHFRGTRQPAPT